MRCLKQYISVPRTILVTVIIISLVHCILCSEESDNGSDPNKQNYGRRTRRVMRPLAKSESSLELAVSRNHQFL